jgi:hypothetical protein
MECRARVMYGFFVSDEMMIATKEGNDDCCIVQHIDAHEEGVMFLFEDLDGAILYFMGPFKIPPEAALK